MLAGLGHRAVGRGHDQDRAVHLGGAGDHVLDVVGVAGAVDVGVVAGLGLVLDVGDGDRDPALALLGRVVDRVEGAVLGLALQGEVLGDRRGQARLAVVDVADRADVDVRLGALELLLGHVTVLTPYSRGSGRDTTRDPGGRAAGGAHNRTRTDDLFLTKEVLCQLSYVGPECHDDALVGREGIEPPQSKTADLQSAELTTCSTYPLSDGAGPRLRLVVDPAADVRSGADDGTRTRNRRFTKPLLYQLSYVGTTAGPYRR